MQHSYIDLADIVSNNRGYQWGSGKNIEQSNKWEALISFLGEKERKKNVGGRKDRVRACPCVEISPSLLSSIVYTTTELLRAL